MWARKRRHNLVMFSNNVLERKRKNKNYFDNKITLKFVRYTVFLSSLSNDFRLLRLNGQGNINSIFFEKRELKQGGQVEHFAYMVKIRGSSWGKIVIR